MQNCSVCGSSDTGLFMRGIYDSETTDVIECGNCGLQFLSPLMTEQEEEEYYSGYYRKQQSRGFKEMSLADQQERSWLHYEQYREVYLGLVTGCRSILEIGSGTGGFLRFLKQNCPHIELTATERCEENAAFIRKSFCDAIVADDLDRMRGKQFDCVLALGVFEHLRDSQEFLLKMRSHLKEGGRLVLKVPNKNNALVHAYASDEFRKFMYMKQHYYTFTEKAFEILAERTGYSVAEYSYVNVWGLDNHLSWLRHRKPRDFSDISSFLSKETLDSYNRDLINARMTDTFMAILMPLRA